MVRPLSKSDRKSEEKASGTSGNTGRGSDAVNRARKILGQVVWVVFLVAALFLAVGALLVALEANEDNALVKFVLDVADVVDLGVFSRRNGVMEFDPPDGAKNALVNWGLGAVVWLVVGRILDRIIKP